MHALFVGLGLSLALLAGCTPAPRYVPCSNHGDCAKVDARYGYCAEGHCVECLGDSGCDVGGRCLDGVCARVCQTQVDCREGESCKKGQCER